MTKNDTAVAFIIFFSIVGVISILLGIPLWIVADRLAPAAPAVMGLETASITSFVVIIAVAAVLACCEEQNWHAVLMTVILIVVAVGNAAMSIASIVLMASDHWQLVWHELGDAGRALFILRCLAVAAGLGTAKGPQKTE